MTTISLRIPESLHATVKQLVKREGISINQFITLALAEKVTAIATEEYLEERAKRGSRENFWPRWLKFRMLNHLMSVIDYSRFRKSRYVLTNA